MKVVYNNGNEIEILIFNMIEWLMMNGNWCSKIISRVEDETN